LSRGTRKTKTKKEKYQKSGEKSGEKTTRLKALDHDQPATTNEKKMHESGERISTITTEKQASQIKEQPLLKFTGG